MNCRTKEHGVSYKVGREGGERTNCIESKVTCKTEKSPAQEPGDEGVSCQETRLQLNERLDCREGRPRMTMTLYTRALSAVPYSPSSASAQLKLGNGPGPYFALPFPKEPARPLPGMQPNHTPPHPLLPMVLKTIKHLPCPTTQGYFILCTKSRVQALNLTFSTGGFRM